jgi:HEAT repeat protein
MREARKTVLFVVLGVSLLAAAGLNPRRGNTGSTAANAVEPAIGRKVAQLKAGKAQEKAAAAYWLGQQHSAAATAVDPLVNLLGDTTAVNPAQYRANRAIQKMTLGEEAAAALVKIGNPAIEPLLRVLKSSPVAAARRNAAWALGALHDTGATSPI